MLSWTPAADGRSQDPAGAVCDDQVLCDTWMRIEPSMEAQQAIFSIPKALRARMLTILTAKMQQMVITNPSQYLVGIIRKESQRAPYPASRPSLSPQSAATPQAAGRSVATPHNHSSSLSSPRPPWIDAAWHLTGKPSQLIRKLAPHIGAPSVQALSAVAPDVQLAMIVSLLLLPAAWGNPGAHILGMIQTAASLPHPAASAPSAALSNPSRPLVVVQMGPSCGVEWLLLDAALQTLQSTGQGFTVLDRISFVGAVPWCDALKPIVAAMGAPNIALHSAADTFAQQVSAAMESWSTSDVTILVMLTVPHGDDKMQGPTALPHMHSEPGDMLWHALQAMQALQQRAPNRYVELVFAPHWQHLPQGNVFPSIFGEGEEISKVLTKVPAAPWRMFSWPRMPVNSMSARKLEPFDGAGVYHPAIQNLTQGRDTALSLPEFTKMEQFWDSRSFSGLAGVAGSAEPATMHCLRAQPSAQDVSGGRLLSANQLSHLWGLGAWNWTTAFLKACPCVGRINKATGQPAPATATGAGIEDCGVTRYCCGCALFYQALMECPPPHAWTNLAELLKKSVGCTARISRPDGELWAALCRHACDSRGCACV